MRTVEYDKSKMPLIMALIERLAEIYDEEDYKNDSAIQAELQEIEQRLIEQTGKTIEDCQPFEQYWSYTSLKTIAKRVLLPKPKPSFDMSENEIRETVHKILHAEYDEAETDYWVGVLSLELNIPDLETYLFNIEELDLDLPTDSKTIEEKILKYRGNQTIYL